MTIFDKYFLKRDVLLKRRVEVDKSLYDELIKLSEIYDASINKLVNVAIVELIENKNIKFYERNDNEIIESHNFAIRKSSYKELERLKEIYGISIYKLINIAIYNALNKKI